MGRLPPRLEFPSYGKERRGLKQSPSYVVWGVTPKAGQGCHDFVQENNTTTIASGTCSQAKSGRAAVCVSVQTRFIAITNFSPGSRCPMETSSPQ